MNLANWLQRAAMRWPARPAICSGIDTVCDYRGFAGLAAANARRLVVDHGLRPGDRVAFFMKNDPSYLVGMYAAWWAGLVVVPINAKLHAVEAAWILEDADCGLCITDAGHGPALHEAGVALHRILDSAGLADADAAIAGGFESPAERRPEDLAWLFYTSGTTGRPKGVMLSHRNLQVMSLDYAAEVAQVDGEDTALYAAPLSHGAGLYNMAHVLMGGRHVLTRGDGFDPDEVLALAAHHGRATMFAAPTMVRLLLDAAIASGSDGEGIGTIVYGGGPMYLADIEAAIAHFGQRFVQIYGQGESPMTITFLSRADHADVDDPRYRERLASVGRAQASVEVRVVDEAGRPLPAGEIGEVVVRGDVVMSGYWRNPEASAGALRDGWLWTGDLGELDADGYLTLKDRSKDLIISGGTNIYPREVEEALLTHPGVAEVSVIGEPDPRWGERVVAFVRANEGAAVDAADLDAHCLAMIARFKRPKRYLFVDSLPKNNNGKVLKTELRKRLAGPA
ncbi:MAG: AMP-binding protein [Burkholderiaceae bacterium]|nr:AMP-binding protein [Burkholderiaceae bacterium]MEB2320171.1 AMP-binding protein [Pseudomonadota bacterium]